LKGKTVQQASDQVRTGGLVPIPITLMVAQYRLVILCVDVMKVSTMPFLVTMSRAIKFGTVAWLKNAKTDTILKNIAELVSQPHDWSNEQPLLLDPPPHASRRH
jgi:hypothetical protein